MSITALALAAGFGLVQAGDKPSASKSWRELESAHLGTPQQLTFATDFVKAGK